jgi:hypothetical protein
MKKLWPRQQWVALKGGKCSFTIIYIYPFILLMRKRKLFKNITCIYCMLTGIEEKGTVR